jgi:Protein of unknown function (DUF1559)
MIRTHFRWLLFALLLSVSPISTRLPAGDAPLPADLALVPADGLGFVHVRLADVWKSELFKEWRQTLLKAGDEALAAFDKRFVPMPSSIDRITVALTRNNNFQQEPDVIVILATSKPFDRDAFLERMTPGAEKQQVGGKTFYEVRRQKIGLHFADERTLVFGPAESVHRALRQAPARQGDLASALQQARAGKSLVVAVNAAALMTFLPPAALQQIPPPFQPLLRAKAASLTLDLERSGQLDFRLVYANAQQAGEAEQAFHEGIKLGRTFLAKGRAEAMKKVLGDGKPGTLDELPESVGALFGLGMINRLEEFLADPPLKKEGTALSVALPLPQGSSAALGLAAVSTALLVPAVQKVREAASRTQDQNNLKQMALAMHFYHEANRGFPAAAICDNNGKPLLSWRVAILPYLEQDPLYKQFKLDEPWNSEHNRKLIPLMPKLYEIPAAPPKPGETHYRVFVGGGAMFELNRKTRIADITDGTSNTLMIVETADSVPWTKPEDIPYDAQKPLPKLGGFYAAGCNVALADASVRFMSLSIAETTLRALITRAGGEAIGDMGR